MKKSKTIFLFACLLCLTVFVNAQKANTLTPEQKATQQRLAAERARKANTEAHVTTTAHVSTVTKTTPISKTPVVDQKAIDKMNAAVKQRHETMAKSPVVHSANKTVPTKVNLPKTASAKQ